MQNQSQLPSLCLACYVALPSFSLMRLVSAGLSALPYTWQWCGAAQHRMKAEGSGGTWEPWPGDSCYNNSFPPISDSWAQGHSLSGIRQLSAGEGNRVALWLETQGSCIQLSLLGHQTGSLALSTLHKVSL